VQTYGNIEIIVVANGEPIPQAAPIVDNIIRAHPECSIRFQELPQPDVAAARQFGAEIARGEFLLFFDDDDIAGPALIETMVTAIKTTGADVIGSAFYVSRPESAVDVELWGNIGGSLVIQSLRHCRSSVAALLRRTSYLEVGGFNGIPGLSTADWALSIRLSAANKSYCFVPQPLWTYRVSDDSMFARANATDIRRALGTFDALLPPAFQGFGLGLYGLSTRIAALSKSEGDQPALSGKHLR
jgi:glycosyltransferase involved in cell wall biosynthesis